MLVCQYALNLVVKMPSSQTWASAVEIGDFAVIQLIMTNFKTVQISLYCLVRSPFPIYHSVKFPELTQTLG